MSVPRTGNPPRSSTKYTLDNFEITSDGWDIFLWVTIKTERGELRVYEEILTKGVFLDLSAHNLMKDHIVEELIRLFDCSDCPDYWIPYLYIPKLEIHNSMKVWLQKNWRYEHNWRKL